jgi:hypothetical protein|tara:strand:+ start:1282 stop:3273 length:1992 start_codon:yes stop_codon:yes gene_type:complete
MSKINRQSPKALGYNTSSESFKSREILIIETDQLANMGEKLVNLKAFTWSYIGNNWPIYYTIRQFFATYGEESCSGPLINSMARKIRCEYLQFEKILSSEQNKLLWQATDLAEKNPLNNTLFIDICKTLVLLDLVRTKTGNLIFIVDDIFLGEYLRSLVFKKGEINTAFFTKDPLQTSSQIVSQGLKTKRYWKQSGLNEINHLFEIMSLKKVTVNRIRSEKRKTAIVNNNIDVLIVIWATPNTFTENQHKVRDNFFGKLPGYLLEKKLQIAYLVLPIDWQYPFEKIIKNAIEAKDQVYTLYDCIDLNLAKNLALDGINESIKLKERFVIKGVDFTPLLKKSYLHEKSKSRQFWALNYYYIAKYFKENCINISNLLINYENQPWEKSLRLGFRRWSQNTHIIQYDHSNIGKFWLSAFPGKKEIRNGNVPDTLSVFGQKCKESFMEDGYAEQQVTVWPAFRYENILNYKEITNTPEENPKNYCKIHVLISLNISSDDSLELLSKALLATEGLSNAIIRVRFHPVMGPPNQVVDLVMEICNWEKLPENIAISTGCTLEVDLDWADVVLLSGSGVEVEAAAKGCYTIFVASDCIMDINYLDFNEHNTVVRTITEIKKELTYLCNNRKQLAKTPWSKRKRELYFEPISHDSLKNVFLGLNAVKDIIHN